MPPMFASIDATGWAVIVGAVFVGIAQVVGLVLAYLKARTVTEKVESIAKVADATHTLVNSNMGIQLKVSAVALRRVADLTRNASDIAAAELAEKALEEHESKQAKVDRGETTPLAAPTVKKPPAKEAP